MRVYEYAKSIGMQAKDLLTILVTLGHSDKTMFSGLDDDAVAALNAHFAGQLGMAPVVPPPPKPQSAARRHEPKPAPAAKAKAKEPEPKKVEPPRAAPAIRIIRREDIERRREEERRADEARLEEARREAEAAARAAAEEARREMEGHVSPPAAAAPPAAAVPTETAEPPAGGPAPAEPSAADDQLPPAGDESAEGGEAAEQPAAPADGPAPAAPAGGGPAPAEPSAADGKPAGLFIRPIKPVLAVQAIGRAQGMGRPATRSENGRTSADFSIEELERQLLGRTSVRSDGSTGPRPGDFRPPERERQYSASGTRLDIFDAGKGRKKKTSRKEKKAAMKARDRAEEIRREEAFRIQEEREMAEGKIVKLEGEMTVKDLCDLIEVPRTEVVKKIMNLGIMNINNQKLGLDVCTLICEEYGFQVKQSAAAEEEVEEIVLDEPDIPENMTDRPPIVTVMGHVDHGKTSLLDAIRHTDVAAGEAGGITQHIGAYQVMLKNGRKVTFLDTPGHEAFTAMRAQGAAVTDIAVLVVGADDGVQPQTIEAMDHAQAAGVPVVVAINKIDKAEANVDKVKQELASHGLTPEDWGGETVCVEVSAKKRVNIDSLLDMLMLVADMKELKADPKRRATGVVIEAKLDKGRGPVANVLVQKGTLSIGDSVVVGGASGKVRALVNDKGQSVKSAPPSTPIQLVGLSSLPNVGERFYVMPSERAARIAAEKHAAQVRMQQVATKKISLNQLFDVIKKGEIKDLNIVIKSDVIGSSIALKDSLEKLSNDKVRVNVVHSGIGQISENDVMLASASNALIIGFHVRPSSAAEKVAQAEHVEIRVYRIIYDAINDVKLAMAGMLEPTFKDVVVGRAEVRDTFKIPNVGVIAGCFVTEGKILRSAKVRLVRDGVEVYEGNIRSLKRFKDDVTEVEKGYECGLGIEKFNDIKKGDIIEIVQTEEVKAGAAANATASTEG